jgi:hypothetical protein
MKLITDILVIFDSSPDMYIVQGEINLGLDSIFIIRQASELDIPDFRHVVWPNSEGYSNISLDDFTVLILSSGYEYIIKMPYYEVMLKKNS